MAEIKFKDNSDKFKDGLQEAVAIALEACGLQAEGYAKLKCPVDTGNLRNSITHIADDRVAYVGTNVEYAPYVEMGTLKTKAQPFIKPAVQNHKEEYKSIFREYMKGH